MVCDVDFVVFDAVFADFVDFDVDFVDFTDFGIKLVKWTISFHSVFIPQFHFQGGNINFFF